MRVTNAAGSVLSPGAVLAVDAPIFTFTDLGTLGGDMSDVAAMNSRGVVVGKSAISPGVDRAFAFNGRMTDLGTLGGDGSAATQINDADEIVGWSEVRDGAIHAFVHRNDRMKDVFTSVGAFPLPPASADAALLTAPEGPTTAHAYARGSGIGLVEIYAVDAAADASLINLSARYHVGSGDEVLLGGIVVAPGAPKTFLLRGIGPGLTPFGVTDALVDPVLEIFDHDGVRIGRNDDWLASLAPIARQVGAFDLTAGSKDAALVLTLGPGTIPRSSQATAAAPAKA